MKNNYLYIAMGTILLILFATLQPVAKTYILPFSSNKLLQKFILISKRAGSIDPQLFWKTREYYAPGYIILKKNNREPKPFLRFQSKKWKSIEMLTTSKTIYGVFPNINTDCRDIILHTNNDLICTKRDSSILIAFIRGQDDMRRANVFYDTKHDKNLIKDKNWLVISQIQ